MLESFKTTQEEAYKIVTTSLKNGTISHAYLIETKGTKDKMSFALSFAKRILCPKSYGSECGECTQCERIDVGTFSDLCIIETDSMQIKKDQVKELQKIFSTKSIESGKRVYIIKDANKMNESTSNTILKFLEEPDDNIIALLQTDNIYQLAPTIVSRCQRIRLKEEKEDLLFNIDEEHLNYVEKAIEFIHYYEKNKLNTILFMDSIWANIFKVRETTDYGLEVMTLYYKDILNFNLGRNLEQFSDYRDKIEELQLDSKKVIEKINLLITARTNLRYNVNSHLLMDKLIMDFKGVDEND